LVCDQAANTLKLYGGFESQRGYVSADTGQIMFKIDGIDNPSDTKIKHLTVKTYHTDEGQYEIDSSSIAF
jgi:hypothetical protein